MPLDPQYLPRHGELNKRRDVEHLQVSIDYEQPTPSQLQYDAAKDSLQPSNHVGSKSKSNRSRNRSRSRSRSNSNASSYDAFEPGSGRRSRSNSVTDSQGFSRTPRSNLIITKTTDSPRRFCRTPKTLDSPRRERSDSNTSDSLGFWTNGASPAYRRNRGYSGGDTSIETPPNQDSVSPIKLAGRESDDWSEERVQPPHAGVSSSSPSSQLIPHSDDTLFSKKYRKFETEFNDKEKTADALMKCGSHRDPLYRRVVFTIIEKMNDTLKCNRTQRDLILQSISLICSDDSSDADHDLRDSLDEVLVFLCTAFKDLLCRHSCSSRSRDFLKMTIRLVGALALRGEGYTTRLRKHRVVHKMLDEVVKRTSPEQVVQEQEGGEEGGTSVAQNVINVAMQTLLLIDLMDEVKIVLKTMSVSVSVSVDKSSSRYSELLARDLSRCEDLSTLLFNSRAAIGSLLRREHFTAVQQDLFRSSDLISQLMRRCDTSRSDLCSHVLKILLLFSELKALRSLIVEEHAGQFGEFVLSFLRCDETGVEALLVKFWLMRRVCATEELRDVVFCMSGTILLIVDLLRTVTIETGESTVLTPFVGDGALRNQSMAMNEVIVHFVEAYECGDDDLNRRRGASEVLLSLASGLQSQDCLHKEDIAEGFVSSGVIVTLLHVLREENNAEDPEWRERALRLLVALLNDSSLRKMFLGEPLLDLHSLVNSYHSYLHRSNAVVALLSVVEVLSRDPLTHPRLFESDVIIDVVNHIKKTLTTSCRLVSEEVKTSQLLQCLTLLESIASVDESQKMFKKMKLDDFLKLLLRHGRKAVRDVVSQVLERVGLASDRVTWKTLFKQSEVSVNV